MGSGWHEWPLVIFTVFGQCVAGALIVMGFVWLKENDDKARMRIVRSLFFLWLVMGIGFMASVLHLGSPLRAFNSLNRVGASALSNEIAAGSIFFAVGGFWWLVSVIGKMPPALGKIWLVVSQLLGIVFVWAMTRVYQIETVPTSVYGLHHAELLPDDGPCWSSAGRAAATRRKRDIQRYSCRVCQRTGNYRLRGGRRVAKQYAGDDTEFHPAGQRPPARLWLASGVAHRVAGGGFRLLDLPAYSSSGAKNARPVCRCRSGGAG